MADAIRTDSLSKSFADFEAVIDVSLRVEANEIYGFLGPNGAGKTTTIMMLLGLERPTRGVAHLLDSPSHAREFAVRRRLGVLGERQVFFDDMTAREYLRFFGRLYRVDRLDRRIDALLERVNLAHAADARARDFSRGMQQKLGLVRALLHDPELLILDEPVSALDPRGVVEVRELLHGELGRGKTVLISSHVLTEVEQLADRIGIMNKGRLVVEDTLDNIRQALQPEARILIELAEPDRFPAAVLLDLDFVSRAELRGGRLSVHLTGSATPAARAGVSRAVGHHGGVIVDMHAEQMTLEQAFVTITDEQVERLAA